MALIDKLTAIADAIREKTGKTDGLTLDQMPGEIAGIQTGGGGGSEFFGMLNDMWAYGTFNTQEYLADRMQGFYISIPTGTGVVIFFRNKKPNISGRPVYIGTWIIGASAFCGEGIAVPTSAEGGVTGYTNSIRNFGISNGQNVVYAIAPLAAVSAPSNGYEMTFMLFKYKNSPQADAPQYYGDKIHLTNLEPNTWVTIPGTEQKVYFGFVAPELDA